MHVGHMWFYLKIPAAAAAGMTTTTLEGGESFKLSFRPPPPGRRFIVMFHPDAWQASYWALPHGVASAFGALVVGGRREQRWVVFRGVQKESEVCARVHCHRCLCGAPLCVGQA